MAFCIVQVATKELLAKGISMGAFDQIIGYTAVKQRLERTADVLAHPDAYRQLGARSPRAMLLYGEPGVGKTLMARCLIEASGRASVVCRKDEPNGEFVKVIKKKFKKAAEKAPSILLLDDMDKFANEDSRHRDAEEYVTVQSCLDELAQSGAEVFVLATANDTSRLPYSLMRSGRLGTQIEVECPSGTDAEAILSHYLAGKKIVDDIDPAFLARVLGGNSCATLEEVANEAGLLAGYDRSETITQEHFMKAVLSTVHGIPEAVIEIPKTENEATQKYLYTAYHEAGHVVVSEVIDPGSTTLATVFRKRKSRFGGLVLSQRSDANVVKMQQANILAALGSKAAQEQKFGIMDKGAERDMADAFDRVKELVEDSCYCGLNLYCDGYGASEDLKSRIEQATAAEIERYYRKAKEILSANMDFLDAVANSLLEKGILTMRDIAKIKETCDIVSVPM